MRLPTYKVVMPLFTVAALPMLVTGHYYIALAILSIGVLYSWQEWLSGQARLTDDDFNKMQGKAVSDYCLKGFNMLPPSGQQWDNYCKKHSIQLEDLIAMTQASTKD